MSSDGGQKLIPDDNVDVRELRDLIELSDDLLAITDRDGHFFLLNQAWEYALGYSREELRARPFAEFVHPQDREKTRTTEQRMQGGASLIAFQNRYIAKDGSVVPLRWHGAFSSEKGRFYTVCKNMAQTLEHRAQTALLDAVLALSDAAIVVQAADGTLSRWEGAAEQLFGWEAAEVVGRPISELLMREGKPIDLSRLLDAAGGADDLELCEGLRHRDGSMIDVRVSAREYGDGSAAVGVVARVSLLGG